MSRYTLGVDTSNYATSLAVFDTAGEVVCAKKRFLPVKPGQLGLRQSDALFHHTTALPEMLHELAQEFDLTRIDAVGVSQKPRPVLRLLQGAGGQKCGAVADRICGNLAKNFPFGVLSDIIGKHTIRSGRANGLFI